MLLKKLILKNFGQFRGRHEFDLEPKKKYGKAKPIILFGGKNGAGKTTILEAVKLSLYGANILGSRTSKIDYHNYLSERIHRNRISVVRIDQASVQLDFEFIDSSGKHIYSVCRSWNRKGKVINEHLSISKNNELLSELDSDYWQDFINDLIPQGLSSLFFFDGEKIQGLADNGTSNEHLCDSIKCLLGLDLIDRLKADLRIYLTRQLRKENKPFNVEFSGLEADRVNVDNLLRQLKQDRASTENYIQNTRDAVNAKEQALRQMGGAFATKRNELIDRKAGLNAEIESLQSDLKEICSDLLPFSICPDLLTSLKIQLTKEQAHQDQTTVKNHFKKNREILEEKANQFIQKNKLSIDAASRAALLDLIEGALSDSVNQGDVVHALSQGDTYNLLSHIEKALHETPLKMQELVASLERKIRELQNVESQIQQAPESDTLSPLMQELSALHQELGMWNKKAMIQDEEIQKQTNAFNETERKLNLLKEKAKAHEQLKNRIGLIEKTEKALSAYQERLIDSKIAALETHFIDSFNTLLRKKNYIARISINRSDFTVVLYDKDNNIIPKDALSAGEKQIYAVAMLWALAKTSGRALPVIIDTPLGRLDSEHRFHLIERYFPFASHQVIILSTDTEVDENYFKKLSIWTSHTFHLVFDQSEENTQVEDRYFDFSTNRKEDLVSASN